MTLGALLLHLGYAVSICLLSFFITWVLSRWPLILDVPNERSSHLTPVPRGGGLAIVIAFFAGIALVQMRGEHVPIRTSYFVSFLVALLLIAGVSFYDDIKHRGVLVKLGGQFVAVVVAMGMGNVIDMAQLPWFGKVYSPLLLYPLSLVWLLGMTNAYNFLDGLDGMAASTAVIVCFFFSYIAFVAGSQFSYLVSLSLGAACLGFLMLNWSPARIFMGDIGSAFLGFAFAILAIIAARYDHGHTSLFVMPLLLFHFIFDALFTFGYRVARREKLVEGHRGHLYQLLNRMGWSHTRVTIAYSVLPVLQGVAAIWMINQPGENRLLAFVPFVLLYCIAGMRIRSAAAASGLHI